MDTNINEDNREKIRKNYIELLQKEDQDIINRASLLDAKINAFIFALITFLTIAITIIQVDMLRSINPCNKYFTILLCVLIFIILVFILLIIILFILLKNYSIKGYKRTGFEDEYDLSDIQKFEDKVINDYKDVIKHNSSINDKKTKHINELIYSEIILMVVMIFLLVIFNIFLNI